MNFRRYGSRLWARRPWRKPYKSGGYTAIMDEAEWREWMDRCPCGCDVKVSDDDYARLHGDPQ